MKRIVLLVALMTAGYALAGSKRVSAEEAWMASLPDQNADYGAYPEGYEDIVKGYYGTRLKDSDSAKYSDFREPRPNHRILSLKERSVQYGYVACVYINAKNSYGGYTGNKLAWLFIRDNAVVESALQGSSDVLEQIRYLGALKRGDCAQ